MNYHKMNITSIQNEHLQLDTLDRGAIIQKLWVRDNRQMRINVVVGYDDLDYYKKNKGRLGATMGRVAGRIKNGEFPLGDKIIVLDSHGKTHLHGGTIGFDAQHWELIDKTEHSVTYQLHSPHLDQGYPGNLQASVTYTLVDHSLEISYHATTDQTTIVSLTNHSYFNLNGQGDIKEHQLQIYAQEYLEMVERIPTGKILKVKDTSLDFCEPTLVGEQENFEGFDHCFVAQKIELASLFSPKSGISMRVHSDQPAVVIYTPPKFLDRIFVDGAIYNQYPAICFEAQGYSDAANNPNFPSIVLEPSKEYRQLTSFIFDTICK